MALRKIIFWEVDAQLDFMLPGGKLYVPGAEEIIPNIGRLVDAARDGRVFLVSSCDAHAVNDPEFEKFAPHCIRGTLGARILAEGMTENALHIPNEASFRLAADFSDYKQAVIEKQTLDVFDNPHAGALVERLGLPAGQAGSGAEYVVFGVATEYCVRLAAKGLAERGRKVAVVEDAIAALDPEAGRRTLEELQARGVRLITTEQALATVRG
ncbi:MAG: isochorismatase family cysteine hydrolase [Candidatus Acidiferrales bacterium]